MALSHDLQRIITHDRVKTRLIDRHSYARDASFYRLIPQAVVKVANESEVQALFNYSQRKKIPLVFRAAGTSLSGQAITDGILVEATEHWRAYNIALDASTISLQPGIIGAHANRLLAPLGRKIGPDPASINSSMIGGIVANNASGMCCGVQENSYHTLASIRAILPNGYIIDTADSAADEKLAAACPMVHSGLLALRERILGDTKLSARIRDKYQRKNTLGYSLNALLDYDTASEILGHLLVGSEGTLGFISEVRFRTIEDPPFKATGLLFFEDIRAATETVTPLRDMGARALELMDRAALRSVQDEAGMPGELKTLPSGAAALLCEFQAENPEALSDQATAAQQTLTRADLLHPPEFKQEQATRDLYWKVRKGLFPAVGAVRRSGTTVIIEDVCYRLENLADATLELQGLMKTHGYADGIIFGHAKEGNLHFVISQEFNDDAGLNQYQAFMDDVVAMTAGKYDGALKAEHGTGRNMAPFVETEWGPTALSIMHTLKALLDPRHLLNPGVILNDDPQAHLQDIKPTPSIEAVADRCIECGFCEVWCPSQALTMSPRRRIATWREIQFLEKGDAGDRQLARQLRKDYAYESVDTCAVDGLCTLGCPVKINTGELTHIFRAAQHGPFGRRTADWTVQNFNVAVDLLRRGLNLATPLARILGRQRLADLSRRLYRLSGRRIPAWHPCMPTGGKGVPGLPAAEQDRHVVYFISCLNRGMDAIPGEAWKTGTAETVVHILAAAGIQAHYPPGLEGLCCGTPYSSKGYDKAYRQMAEKATAALWRASHGGRLPILVDTSPCTFKMKSYGDVLVGKHLEYWQQMQIYDIIEYLHDEVLPRLPLKPIAGTAVLHPTCSCRKMGLEEKMLAVARQCAEQAEIPMDAGCCGFAGDRGFLIPELTESATQREAAEVRRIEAAAGHYSTSRTCEMGMSAATDRTYSALIQLVGQALENRQGGA